MRVTLLHPDADRGAGTFSTDVDLLPGTSLAALRPALAQVSGHPGWTSTAQRVYVGSAALDEDHVSGQPPLVLGSTLSLAPQPRPGAEDALREDWHVGSVAGPDCGVLTGLPDGVRIRVGPSLVVRRRGDRVRYRTGHRYRRWRRWPSGTEVTSGPTTYALRPRTPPPADEPGHQPDPGPARSALITSIGSAAGSVAIAVALHQPLLALVGLVGPLALLGSAATGRRRGPAVAVPDDPASLVADTVRSLPHRDTAVPWDERGALAVVGPRALVLPVARAAVLSALGGDLSRSLVVRTRRPADWTWTVWATCAATAPDLVVVDDPPAAARAPGAARPDQRLLVVAASSSDVPAWCRSTLEVSRGGARLRRAGEHPTQVPLHAVTRATAEAQLRRAAGRAASGRASTGLSDTGLPSSAVLGRLPGVPAPTAAAVAAAWERPPSGLVATLGVGAAGSPVVVDLAADGPHALIAGTTGAGKSELLTTLVLALALTHPPERLALLLVDFKGGTGLGAVAGLPHVLEHVTDLDAAHAHRVLSGLRAEIRRRERGLVAAGARDVADLAGPHALPRLVVVVDELRALTEDVPEASAALARLAAQGRALGVHLVLATQRPAGCVGADLRANIGLRIALRVADAADSTDVLDAPDAAAIARATPGRALVRSGSSPLEPVQVARAVLAPALALVRPAAPWGASAGGWSPPPLADRGTDPVTDWVAAAVAAAVPRRTPPTPWLPALPPVVGTTELGRGAGLALGLADLPDEQRRTAVRWDPTGGHLLVLGGPRSGRSTALVTVGLGALARGLAVHVVGLADEHVQELRSGDRHGRLGSVLAVDDAVEVARLLELLGPADGPSAVLLVDRVDLLLGALGALARGAGADRLTAAWRGGRRAGTVGIAATADVGAGMAQHAASFRDRLVLPLADPVLDSLAGVPAAFAGPRLSPGRAVHLHPGGAQLVQVASFDEVRHVASARDPSVARVRPLPRRVPLPDAGTAGGTWRVPVGVGGDDASPVLIDVSGGILIAGPPGSGRSTALAVVALGLERSGHPVLHVTPSSADELLGSDPGAQTTLLVDDVDELERTHPELVAGLGHRVVATCTAQSAAGAYRGAVPALLRGRRLLVLDLHDQVSADLVGPGAAWLADPARRIAGRGAVVLGREVTPVQVYAPG